MDLDIGINTMHGKLSHQNILAEVNGAQGEDSNDQKNKNNNDEPITKPETEEARKVILILKIMVVSIKKSYVTKNKSILLMF